MCNIFKKDRLFKISNPCCCCSLRCGTLWICITSFILGFGCIFLPYQLNIQYDMVPNKYVTGHSQLEVKQKDWMDEPLSRFTIHYGCQIIQMVSAVYLGSTDVCKCGGLCNFISGTVWMVARVFVTVLWVLLLYRIPFIKKGFEDLGIDTYKWERYQYVLIANIVIHCYFLIVVRYYTMESWDIWSYRPRTPDFRHPLRRNVPPVLKDMKRKYKFKRRPRPTENLTEYRQRKLFHARVQPEIRDQNDWELEGGLPLWQFGKEFIIRGEDYSKFDPMWNFENFQRLANTGVLDWPEEDLLDEDKLEEVHQMLLATVNIPPSEKDIPVKKEVSKDSIVGKDGPFLVGYHSGHVHVHRGSADPGHHEDPSKLSMQKPSLSKIRFENETMSKKGHLLTGKGAAEGASSDTDLGSHHRSRKPGMGSVAHKAMKHKAAKIKRVQSVEFTKDGELTTPVDHKPKSVLTKSHKK